MTWKFIQMFINEPSRSDKGQVYEDSRRFRRGQAIWTSKTNLVLPFPLILTIEVIIMSSVILDTITNPKTVWIDKTSDFCLACNCLSFYITAFLIREDIGRLSDSVDYWWRPRLLDREVQQMKKMSVEWIKNFNSYYLSLMLLVSIAYSVLPFVKYFMRDSIDFSDIHIVKMWTPISQNRLGVFIPLYIFQILHALFMINGYATLTAYMMSVASTCSFQIQIVGISCTTIQERVLTILKDVPKDSPQWQSLYSTELMKEIADCAKHYQHVYRNWKELCRLLSIMADLVFYSGMCIVSMFGVRVATERHNLFVELDTLLFLIVITYNQYLFTSISGVFTDQVIKLQTTVYECPWYDMPTKCQKSIQLLMIMFSRVPSISTVMGVESTREFCLKTINATYFYISALISLN